VSNSNFIYHTLGSELYEKKLKIIGLGATAVEVTKRAKCFGMYITAVTKHPDSKKKKQTDNNNNNKLDFFYK
jgi:phosphoglycerate dehydrogenase-like enzyme